jgi:DsbC/DsbD-like thiol-disulfide interchange protein
MRRSFAFSHRRVNNYGMPNYWLAVGLIVLDLFLIIRRYRAAVPLGVVRPSRALIIVASAMIMCGMPCAVLAQSADITLPGDSTATTPPAANPVAIAQVKNGIEVHADEVKAAIRLGKAVVPAGGTVAVTAHFAVAPGWHIYGAPLPPGEDLTPTTLSFGQELTSNQSLTMPPPAQMRFEALGETLPVYTGDFTLAGRLQLKPNLKPGPQTLGGELRFQECNDALCKMPRTIQFTIPLQISG